MLAVCVALDPLGFGTQKYVVHQKKGIDIDVDIWLDPKTYVTSRPFGLFLEYVGEYVVYLKVYIYDILWAIWSPRVL